MFEKERLWFNAFIDLRADDRAKYDLPTAQEQAVIDWQTMSLPKNADKYGFFDVLSPQINANGKMVVDHIQEDFTLYKNIDVNNQRFIDGAADAAKRAAITGVSVAAGEVASKAVKAAGIANQYAQLAVGEAASRKTDDILNKPNVYLNDMDRAIFKEIVTNVKDINTLNITGFNFQKNIIGPNEAARMNRELKIVPDVVGATAGTATFLAMKNPKAGIEVASGTSALISATTRLQPYAAGQVEYRAVIKCQNVYNKLYNLYSEWKVVVNYRVGSDVKNVNNFGKDIIEASYKLYFKDQDTREYMLDPKEVKYAPK